MPNRVSLEQRRSLLNYMQGHEDLARGRVSGPDAARNKKLLLLRLSELLNSMGSGATKTPEKWLKCWQDWKSDTKAKYNKIKKARNGTGGGPSPAPLSSLEEDLLQFYGMEMVEGLEGVPDPLTIAEEAPPMDEDELVEVLVYPPDDLSQPSVEEVPEKPPPETPNTRRHRSDPLQGALERQAAAAERQAAAAERQAAAGERLAAAVEIGLAQIADGIIQFAAAITEIAAAFTNRNNP